MGVPALITLNGTASAVWMTDWMQNPFVVGIGLVTGTTGVNGTATVNYALQNPSGAQDVNGTTTPNWFPLITVTAANATALFTTPCYALQVVVATATATSVWTAMFVQATYGR